MNGDGPKQLTSWRKPALAQARAGAAAGAWPSAAASTARTALGATARTKALSGPFLIVLAYLLVEYGRPQDWVPPLKAIRPGMMVLFAGMLALFVRRTLPTEWLVKAILAFLGLMIMSVPFALHRQHAYLSAWDFTFFVFGGLLPIIAFVDSFDRLRVLLRYWVWIHVPLAVYSITHQGFGIGAFLWDENDFALALNIALPYAFGLLMLEKGVIRKLLVLGAIFIFLFAITATMSRGGFLGLLCTAGILWLRSGKKLLSLVLVAVLAVVLVFVTPDAYWKEMQTIETAAEEGDTGYNRLYFWNIGWKIYLDNPVFGVGPNNYGYHAPNYESAREKSMGRHVWGKVAHSLYFTLLPEMGTVGTLLFVAIVYRGWRERSRLVRRCRAVLNSPQATEETKLRCQWLTQLGLSMDVAVVAYLATGAFLSVLYYPHIWIITAYTVVLSRVAAQELPPDAGSEPKAPARVFNGGTPQPGGGFRVNAPPRGALSTGRGPLQR